MLPISQTSSTSSSAAASSSVQNSKQKVGLFLKRNFRQLNSLIEKPSEFQWVGLQMTDNNAEKSEKIIKFDSTFNENTNIEFSYESQEHIWYKNINIPKIKVSQISFYPIEQLRAEVMVFGGVLSGDFQIVETKGKNFFNFHLRECVLKGIRVGETSHTLKGKNLHIVISVSSLSNPLNIHYILVSSGIAIFGRKKKYSQRIDNGLLIEPFIPYYLKEQQDLNEETEGLVSYLTSKKIRHKNKITYRIQDLLMKKFLKKIKEDFLIIRIVATDHSRAKENFQKISKQLSQLSIRILSQNEKIPHNFEKLVFEEDLIDEYCMSYKDISNIKMKFMKKLMNHPQKLLTIYQEGYDETPTESTSLLSSTKSFIKEPFNTNVIDLNFEQQPNCNQLTKIRVFKR